MHHSEFNNPKATVSAIIVRDNKILLLKRNEEPFKGLWDLPGGYMEPLEYPADSLKRELSEELGIEIEDFCLLDNYPGTASWEGEEFAVLNNAYMVDIGSHELRLNNENESYQWADPRYITEIAFDSNHTIVDYLQSMWCDIDRVQQLARQLDSSATITSYQFYKACLVGKCVRQYEGDTLIGMGWIFPRTTMLRKQAVIEDMIVDEAYRGQGYGKKILADLIHLAKEQYIEVIELTTNPKRVAAHALYESFGFQIHETDHMLLKLENIGRIKDAYALE